MRSPELMIGYVLELTMRIDIYIGQKAYGCRFWDTAPRVGEHLTVRGERAGTYEVEEIIWCGDEEPQVILTTKEQPVRT